MLRLVPNLILALALLAALVWYAVKRQRELERALPPRQAYASPLAAETAAKTWVAQRGGTVYPILGTGSMAPYLPAALPGMNPRAVIVAWAVTDPLGSWKEIQVGDLCIYQPNWAKGGSVIHQAVQYQGDGWIMAGLHNKRSESFERMTQEKFIGLVAYCAVVTPL